MTTEEIMKDLKDGKIDNPQVLSEYLVRLSASLGAVGQNILEKEIAYSKKWGEIRATVQSDKQADERIKTELEYAELQGAKILQKTIIETLRAIKHRIRTLGEEWHQQNY